MSAVSIKNLSKSFSIERTQKTIFRKEKIVKDVLTNLNMEIEPSSVIGIVGRNGSGKSTLLKIIAGIMDPNSGNISINGTVASILELGMGFHPELSGRENIYIKCSMYGFSDDETNKVMNSIIDFSELGDQIDDPVRTYSSGMYARLAFSIAINVNCDIIIIDEILSVGDPGFNYKCKLAFKRMKDDGKTMIIASHASGTLESMCDFVYWLDEGTIREQGDPHLVCYHFQKYLRESPKIVMDQACAGVSAAQNKLGELYRDGNNIKKDLNLAEEWFIKASDAGSSDAMVNLGDLKLSQGNFEEAKVMYSMASNAGNRDAIIKLLSLKNSDKNVVEAVNKLKELAEAGNNRALWFYGDALFRGIGVKQNRADAILWLEKAAKIAGDPSAMYQLGMCYRDGIGVTKNAELAEYWLLSAMNHGHTRSYRTLVDMYRRGITVEKNMEKCISLYKKSAEVNDAEAMYQLAVIYRDGIGVDKNEKESQYWMNLFAKQNIIRLEHTLADLLFYKYDNNESRKEAIRWYKMASDGGFVASHWQLGVIYRDGLGVVPSSEEAFNYFSKAAKGRNRNALFELGIAYLKGNGVTKDLTKAENLFRESMNYGNNNARFMLGVLLRDKENPTPSELEESEYLLKYTAEFGHNGALIMINK